jgi:uncharacterized Ntn-hydrolase superfamily protein
MKINIEGIVATYSIVGLDPDSGEIGVGVQSKFPCVGSVVPWVKAGVGAVATQANSNPSFGPRGLRMMADGLPPDEIVQNLTQFDADGKSRQVGLVDALGRNATYTGDIASSGLAEFAVRISRRSVISGGFHYMRTACRLT